MPEEWTGNLSIIASADIDKCNSIAEDIVNRVFCSLRLSSFNAVKVEEYPKFEQSYKLFFDISDDKLNEKLAPLLSCFANNWDVKNSEDECSAVWNKSDSDKFYYDSVFWASVDIYRIIQ